MVWVFFVEKFGEPVEYGLVFKFPCAAVGCGMYAAIAISLAPTPGRSKAIAM